MPLVENISHLDEAAANEYRRRANFGLASEPPSPPLWTPSSLHEAESTDAQILQPVMSAAEIDSLLTTRPPACANRIFSRHRSELASSYVHDVAYSDSHVALFLHRAGHFQTTWPTLSEKLVAEMQRTAVRSVEVPLSVRCVELHTYSPGGSLLNPGHRDRCSVLTMSILLTEPAAGGEFVTWRNGGLTPVVHPLSRGSAVLFHSEKLHNVSTVTRGLRRALVIELWEGGTNVHDRQR